MCPWFSRRFGTGGTTKTRTICSGFLILYIYSMHYLYILYSDSTDRYYVGETKLALNYVRR